VVRTNDNAYVVLVDESASSYFPIQSSEPQAMLVESILSDTIEFNVENYGIYFSFLSMLTAHDMVPTQVSFIVGKKGGVSCSMDVTEENELGFKVSRVPLTLIDAVVLCSVGKMPIVIYGVAGTEFTFKINKDIPKQSVFSFVCDEIVKSERLSSINCADENE
jgi:hypothetical protein